MRTSTMRKMKQQIKSFLRDIRYDKGRADQRSKRFKTIKQLFEARSNSLFGGDLVGPNNLEIHNKD